MMTERLTVCLHQPAAATQKSQYKLCFINIHLSPKSVNSVQKMIIPVGQEELDSRAQFNY